MEFIDNEHKKFFLKTFLEIQVDKSFLVLYYVFEQNE